MYKNYEDLPGVLSVKELKDYLGILRTPHREIASTGEIERRFRWN